MVLLGVVLIIATAVAIGRGGHLKNLTMIELIAWPLLFLAGALQVAAELLSDQHSWSQPAAVTLILGSYVLLLVVIYLNRDRTGLALAGLGVILNFAVIGLNSGMPVSAEAAVLAGGSGGELVFDSKHVALDVDSRLAFLADVIPVRPFRQVLSIGDVFLAVGLGLFVEAELRSRHWLRHAGTGQPGSAAGQ